MKVEDEMDEKMESPESWSTALDHLSPSCSEGEIDTESFISGLSLQTDTSNDSQTSQPTESTSLDLPDIFLSLDMDLASPTTSWDHHQALAYEHLAKIDDQVSSDGSTHEELLEVKNIFATNDDEIPCSTLIQMAPKLFTRKTSDMPSTSGPRKPTREYLFKLLVIGELATGKTSFIKRYVHQFFSDHYRATIGVDFALKILNLDENTIVRLQLWDIAGQERFGNMTRVYYKEAVGAFIVFDVSRPQTLDAVFKWKQDLDSKVQLPDGSPVPCILLANKSDCRKEGPASNPQKLDEYCNENGFAGWFYTSAKENKNVEESAKFLVHEIIKSRRDIDVQEEDAEIRILNSNVPNDSRFSTEKCNC